MGRLLTLLPADLVLAVAVIASLLVAWWLIRKLARLALYAGLVGLAAWLWFFGMPG